MSDDTAPSKQHERLTPGTLVVTTQDNGAKDWQPGARVNCRWGVRGVVVASHDAHGLFYDVRHADGSMAPYEPDEIRECAGECADPPAMSAAPPQPPPLDPSPEEKPVVAVRTWRNDAADVLRMMAASLDEGRASAIVAVTIEGARHVFYRGCTDPGSGALLYTRTLDVLDQLRKSIDGSPGSIGGPPTDLDMMAQALLPRLSQAVVATLVDGTPTEDGGDWLMATLLGLLTRDPKNEHAFMRTPLGEAVVRLLGK